MWSNPRTSLLAKMWPTGVLMPLTTDKACCFIIVHFIILIYVLTVESDQKMGPVDICADAYLLQYLLASDCLTPESISSSCDRNLQRLLLMAPPP